MEKCPGNVLELSWNSYPKNEWPPCKEKNRTRASKTHETISIKISTTYEKLPITFKLQKNLHRKITKAQKLAQIEKFIINVRQHGYVADK